ncbi:MAG: hypothetical protein IKD80_09375 [Selenomonadaceae bacterium]|nr:hypothetical protein [Selenomonadaceae bacterium]
MLEEKFMQTINYVELSEKNFPTYSIEYAYLLQTIGSELDTFFKVYCDFTLEESKTMKDYHPHVLGKYPEIVNQTIAVAEFSLTLTPFKDWNTQPLKWWKAYNSVKHNRYGNLSLACLENVVNALSALFLLELKYLKEIAERDDDFDRPDKESNLFTLPGWECNCVPASQAFLEYMKFYDRSNQSL